MTSATAGVRVAQSGVVIFATMCLLSLAIVTSPRRPAVAAAEAGTAEIIAPGGFNRIPGGGSAQPFTLMLPTDAGCAGDTTSAGYVVTSFMVPLGVDPAGVGFGPTGPEPLGIGGSFSQPLYRVAGEGAFVGGGTEDASGRITSLPTFSMEWLGEAAFESVPPGRYLLGIGCLPPGSSQVDRYWAASIRVDHDPSDVPVGLRWLTDDSRVGLQGTDVALPTTDSAVTVQGRGEFENLAITVNQTANLTRQAISIRWTGGTPTVVGTGVIEDQFLQIFQCWGDDDGTNPSNPGPPPEQCVYGGDDSVANPRNLPVSLGVATRVIASDSWPGFDPNVGYYVPPDPVFPDPDLSLVWRPFRSVGGDVINAQVNPAYDVRNPQGDRWLNPFFNQTTSNEVTAAQTGRGADRRRVIGPRLRPARPGGRWHVGAPDPAMLARRRTAWRSRSGERRPSSTTVVTGRADVTAGSSCLEQPDRDRTGLRTCRQRM
jgi:hypothetical protein